MDNNWYRARVLNVYLDPSTGMLLAADLFYIDYGNMERVTADRYLCLSFQLVTAVYFIPAPTSIISIQWKLLKTTTALPV